MKYAAIVFAVIVLIYPPPLDSHSKQCDVYIWGKFTQDTIVQKPN